MKNYNLQQRGNEKIIIINHSYRNLVFSFIRKKLNKSIPKNDRIIRTRKQKKKKKKKKQKKINPFTMIHEKNIAFEAIIAAILTSSEQVF